MDLYLSIFIFIIGCISGGFIGFLYQKKNQENIRLTELSQIEAEKKSLQIEKAHLEERIKKSIEIYTDQQARERELQEEKVKLSSKLAESNANLKNLEEKLTNQKQELEDLQNRFTKEFKLAADAILKQNSKEFSSAHQKELDQILTPLKDKIKSFEESIEKKYMDETKERTSLKSEIKQLLELNKTLNDQAKNLTSALKGENKTQGNWGEMVLERILESSGLIKGEEYETQFSDTNSDNKRIQPDVLIKLPEGKHIIIDSKVSLVSYERFISEKDENERENHLKAHILSVKTHVKG
ncbi:MAG: DNA recombination protein RmuC [Flavobacteriales bacterium]|nr:DNA recombination protein RmuC [Flavobacteriales bacterium]